MAIRNDNLGGIDFVRESPTWQDMNDTFNAVPRIIGTDLIGGTVTTATTTTTTKIAEVSIAANSVNNYIVVKALFKMRASYDDGGSPGSASASLDLKIGEAGSEVSKKAIGASTLVNEGAVIYNDDNGTFTWYYEPTSDEKTNGFNVQIYGTVTITGTANNAGIASISQMLIEAQ